MECETRHCHSPAAWRMTASRGFREYLVCDKCKKMLSEWATEHPKENQPTFIRLEEKPCSTTD